MANYRIGLGLVLGIAGLHFPCSIVLCNSSHFRIFLG